MPTTRFKAVETRHEGALTIMAQKRDPTLCDLVQKDLETALVLLQRTNGKLNGKLDDKDRGYAHRYFLTDKKAIDPGDLRRIQAVVTMTRTGLKGDVCVKAGEDVIRDCEPTTLGTAPRNGAKAPSEDYHNVTADLETGKVYRYGAIHLSDGALRSGRLGVVTLLHEATHKYAGTIDYGYMDFMGEPKSKSFTDKAKALINADSYAWFILKVGRDLKSKEEEWLKYN